MNSHQIMITPNIVDESFILRCQLSFGPPDQICSPMVIQP